MQQKSIAPAALCIVALDISGVADAADSKPDTRFYGIPSLDYVNASNVYNAGMPKSYVDNGGRQRRAESVPPRAQGFARDQQRPQAYGEGKPGQRQRLIGVGVHNVF